MNLPKPKKQKCEVLYELLNCDRAGRRYIMTMTGILNVPARILDLRRDGVNIICEKVETTNKHGRKISYGEWHIPKEDKPIAIEIYKNINH